MKADERIDAYIARKPDFARPILEPVRSRVRATVPEVEETLKWDASNSDALNGLAELRETKEAGKGGFSIFGKR